MEVEPKLAHGLRIVEIVDFGRVFLVGADEVVVRIGGGRVDDGAAPVDEHEDLILFFELGRKRGD